MLRGVTFGVARGELVALMGLGLGQDDDPSRDRRARAVSTADAIAVDDVDARRRRAIAGRRRCARCARKVGMVFQFHCLFEHLSAIENVCLAPVHVARRRAGGGEARARDCSRRSASSTAPTRCRASSRAAKPSASRLRARSRWIRRCC